MYNYGRTKALELREAAPELTDTEVIDQEVFIPTWKEGIHTAGDPLQYEGQVYRVLQTHDSTGNPTWNPTDLPSLFSICHTKNPIHAKPWVAPTGISGMYELGDCYIDDEGIIWRQVYNDSNVYDAATLPERWEVVNLYEENISEEEEEVEVINEPNNNENNEPDNPPIDEPIIDNPSVNEWPEWIQPVGTQDAYNTDDQVSHSNKHWVSTVDANVWEPGVYGWDEVTE